MGEVRGLLPVVAAHCCVAYRGLPFCPEFRRFWEDHDEQAFIQVL